MRRVTPIVLLVAAAGGCQHGEIRNAFGGIFAKDDRPPGREAPLAAAARVDQVGRQILTANVFVGQDVSFQAVGADDPAVFHRDTYSVFITDVMVDRCRTDGELAAVLCGELAVMIAERRNSARMTVPQPFPDFGGPVNSLEAGGIPADQMRLAEQGFFEEKFGKKSYVDRAKKELGDPKTIAVDLLKTAGYDEKDWDRGQTILKANKLDGKTVKQLAGPTAAPTWSK